LRLSSRPKANGEDKVVTHYSLVAKSWTGRSGPGVDCFDSVAATFPDVVQATHRAIEIQLAMTDFGPPQRFRDLHTRPN